MRRATLNVIEEDNCDRAEMTGDDFQIVRIGPSSYKPNSERQRTNANYLRHIQGVGFKPPQGFGSSSNAGSGDVQLIQIAR